MSDRSRDGRDDSSGRCARARATRGRRRARPRPPAAERLTRADRRRGPRGRQLRAGRLAVRHAAAPPHRARLVRLAFPEEELGRGARRASPGGISPRIVEAPGAAGGRCGASSTSTSSGAGASSRSPLDWTLIGPFAARVLRATAEIPYGGVSATRRSPPRPGSPRGSRAAGNALGSNPIPIVIPCHRVLRSGGALGGYGGGLDASAGCWSSRARSPAPSSAGRLSGRSADCSAARRPLRLGGVAHGHRPPGVGDARACRAGTTRRRAPPDSRSRRR